jgi:clan AA aspartic protease
MGLSYCMLRLKNPRSPQSEPVDVEALGDTGAVYLIIPEHIRLQLALEESSKKEITVADGSKKMVPYVGPIEARFKNRVAYVGAVVTGDEVLLGAIPIKDMDLVVLPQQRRVDIIPSIRILLRRRRNKTEGRKVPNDGFTSQGLKRPV